MVVLILFREYKYRTNDRVSYESSSDDVYQNMYKAHVRPGSYESSYGEGVADNAYDSMGNKIGRYGRDGNQAYASGSGQYRKYENQGYDERYGHNGGRYPLTRRNAYNY